MWHAFDSKEVLTMTMTNPNATAVDTNAGPPPATRILGRFAATLDLNKVPDSVKDRVRTDALDSLAVGVFGHSLPWVQTAVEMWREHGGAEQSRVWG